MNAKQKNLEETFITLRKLADDALHFLHSPEAAPMALKAVVNGTPAIHMTGRTYAPPRALKSHPEVQQPVVGSEPSRKRAMFYMMVSETGSPDDEIIYRVVGLEGLRKANAIKAKVKDPGYARQVSGRDYLALIDARRKVVRAGSFLRVGALSHTDLE